MTAPHPSAPLDVTATPFPAGWYALGPLPAGSTEGGTWPMQLCGRPLTVQRLPSRWSVRVGGRATPAVEHAGLLVGWFHPDGGEPDWQLLHLDQAGGWTPMSFTAQELPIRPLQVMRDLADLAHFETVHLYKKIEVAEPLRCDGPRLHTSIDFGWDTGMPGLDWTVPAGFTSRVEGPGYQLTDVRVPMGQWVSRHLVLPTPLDDGRTALHLGLSIRLTGALGRLEARLGSRLMAPLKAAIHAFVARAYVRDIGRDADLWLSLAQGRGAPAPLEPDLARYHVWASQFC